MELIKTVPILLALLTAIATFWSAAFLTGRFSPNIDLSIEPIWIGARLLKVEIEVENCGSIRIGLQKVLLAVEGIATSEQHDDDVNLVGTEWLSFDNADRIMTSSFYINPKEVIHVERLYDIPLNNLVHMGIQVYLRYPWFIRVLGAQARSVRQTRVYYFSRLQGEYGAFEEG